MSKKNSEPPTGEGTAATVRQATRSRTPSPAGTPAAKAKRRTFTAKYKLRIVREADAAVASGQPVGDLLRREGLYSSHLSEWRKERDAGELAGLAPKKRGRKPSRNPLADENERLRRQVAKLEADLKKAETVIDVQKKVAALLGETLPVPTEEDFARPVVGLISRRRR